jgi:hypothetical protein
MNISRLSYISYKLFAIISLLIFFTISKSQDLYLEKIDDGLNSAEINSPVKGEIGDSKISILKIDPAFYTFKLINHKIKCCK